MARLTVTDIKILPEDSAAFTVVDVNPGHLNKRLMDLAEEVRKVDRLGDVGAVFEFDVRQFSLPDSPMDLHRRPGPCDVLSPSRI